MTGVHDGHARLGAGSQATTRLAAIKVIEGVFTYEKREPVERLTEARWEAIRCARLRTRWHSDLTADRPRRRKRLAPRLASPWPEEWLDQARASRDACVKCAGAAAFRRDFTRDLLDT